MAFPRVTPSAHPGLHADTPFRSVYASLIQKAHPGLNARTPFQGCNIDSHLYPGLRLRLTLGYMPTLLSGVFTLRVFNKLIRGYMLLPSSKVLKQIYLCFFLMLCMCGAVEADPWGKDADLVGRCYERVATAPCSTPLFGQFGETMIKFHQDVISPADGPRSNFRPSSSQYMLDAMRKYGFFKGFSMGCDRLMRENEDPWVYRTAPNENGEMMKWDPVR